MTEFTGVLIFLMVLTLSVMGLAYFVLQALARRSGDIPVTWGKQGGPGPIIGDLDQDQAGDLDQDQAGQADYMPVVQWVNPQQYPAWLIDLARELNTRPSRDLDGWAADVATVGYERGLSPKMVLYPYFQTASGYDVPGEWKTLHALEALVKVFKTNGLAELRNRRDGARLTQEGLDYFQLDPNKWYP